MAEYKEDDPRRYEDDDADYQREILAQEDKIEHQQGKLAFARNSRDSAQNRLRDLETLVQRETSLHRKQSGQKEIDRERRLVQQFDQQIKDSKQKIDDAQQLLAEIKEEYEARKKLRKKYNLN